MDWFKDRTIVVPFDFSDESVNAIEIAKELACNEQDVHVIHVVPDLDATTYPGILGSPFDDDLRKQEAKKKMIERLCDVASDAIALEIRVGDPGHTIVDFAEQIGANLIVIPSHGRTGISRVLMGSVAEHVIRHAHCPILALKHGAKPTGHSDAQINWFKGKSVVVPIYYSDESKQAVRFAEQIGEDASSVEAIHVIPQINSPYVSHVEGLFDDNMRIRTKRHFEEWLAEIPSKITSVHIKVGDPGLTIADFASHLENGLVVIPSHGRSGFARVLMGSVAERVVRHAKCPVLVLKSDKRPREQTVEQRRLESLNEPTLRSDDLLEVYSTDDPTDAEVVRNSLRAEGMKCEIDGGSQGGFVGLTSFSIKLLVRTEDYDRARKFIDTHHPQ